MVENPDPLQENAFSSSWETEPPYKYKYKKLCIRWDPTEATTHYVYGRGLCLSVLLFPGPNRAVKQKTTSPESKFPM